MVLRCDKALKGPFTQMQGAPDGHEATNATLTGVEAQMFVKNLGGHAVYTIFLQRSPKGA